MRSLLLPPRAAPSIISLHVVIATLLASFAGACGDNEEPICGDQGCETGFICNLNLGCVAECGDRLVLGDEGCDDGNKKDGDYCSADCSVVTGSCGDRVQQENELCDADQGCDEQCHAIEGWQCPRGEGCHELCGDWLVVGTEVCDDIGSLYCARDCKSILGECGNGRVEASESCDDGNKLARDGCSPTCGLEGGATCAGAPSRCIFSGLDQKLRIADLTTEQIKTFCEWRQVKVALFPDATQCGFTTYHPKSPQTCQEELTEDVGDACIDTVGRIEECAAANGAGCGSLAYCNDLKCY